MLFRRTSTYCSRWLRYIGHVFLFVCLFTGLNVLGYHYLYGPLTKPQFVQEMSVDDSRQPPSSKSQELPSSRSTFTRASPGQADQQTSSSPLVSRRDHEKSIPDSTSSDSSFSREHKDLTIVVAEASSVTEGTVATHDQPPAAATEATAHSKVTGVSRHRSSHSLFLSSLIHPSTSRVSGSFSSSSSSSFTTRKTSAFGTRNVALSVRHPVTSPTTTEPEPDCGEIPYGRLEKDVRPFKPVLTGRHLCRMLNTTVAFLDALSKANVSFFMYGGTLIGSWRHHSFVPWDDDVDFAVPMDKQQKVYRRLMDLKPKFILDVKQKKRWKLYQEGSVRIPGVSWRYPFLDINFYHQNATHVWDHDRVAYHEYVYPRDWVFPLATRPFHGHWMPAPRETEKSLRLTYDLEKCDTGSYNHREERKTLSARRTVPCERLQGLLPFVQRAVTAGRCVETLVQGGRELRRYTFDNPNCVRG